MEKTRRTEMPSRSNKRRRKIKKFNYLYDYPDVSNVSSATDCTGLMPTPPLFDEEYASYQELCGMQVPKIEPDQRIEEGEDGLNEYRSEKKLKDK
jgi:hypothetical protein